MPFFKHPLSGTSIPFLFIIGTSLSEEYDITGEYKDPISILLFLETVLTT
jgi:hypothetical protein